MYRSLFPTTKYDKVENFDFDYILGLLIKSKVLETTVMLATLWFRVTLNSEIIAMFLLFRKK